MISKTFSALNPKAALEKSAQAESSCTSADGAKLSEGQRVTIDPRMIAHENMWVHRNHILSIGSCNCECKFRISAINEPALLYAAITDVPYGLPSGSLG